MNDDEWIIEKHELYLTNDVSWVNINISSTLEKRAQCNKRKRDICLNFKTCAIKLIINVMLLIKFFFGIYPRNLTTKIDKREKTYHKNKWEWNFETWLRRGKRR